MVKMARCYAPTCGLRGTCYSPACRICTTLRRVVLTRGSSGFGFTISGTDLHEGVTIGDVFPDGPAERTRAIFTGDLIYSIDGKRMVEANHDQIVAAITGKQTVDLVLAAPQSAPTTHLPAPTPARAGPAPPLLTSLSSPRLAKEEALRAEAAAATGALQNHEPTPVLVPRLSAGPRASGAEYDTRSLASSSGAAEKPPKRREVKLSRGNTGFGMKIRSDPAYTGVRVSALTPGGSAMASGLVFVGDVIMEINGVSMVEANHETVVNALVERTDVTLLLVRDDDVVIPQTPALLRKTIRLPRQDSSIGLKLMFNDKEKYPRITDIIPNSAADRDGRICVGDRIVEVNGVRTEDRSNDQIIELLSRGAEVNLILESAPDDAYFRRKTKTANVFRKLFSSPLKKGPPPGPLVHSDSRMSLPQSPSAANVWTQVAEEYSAILEAQLKESDAKQAQQAREIRRLEEQVHRLSNDAAQAQSLRMELDATRAALDELRSKSLVSAADGELRAEVMTLRFRLADLELEKVQQTARATELATRLKATEEEVVRVREAQAEMDRLRQVEYDPDANTETDL